MQKSMVDMGMKKGHICLDMQLYYVCDETNVLEPTWKIPEHMRPSRWHIYKSDIRLHWNFNVMLSLGILCHCSLWRNERYFEREILGKCYESILECSSCTLTTISVNWTKDLRH